MTEIGSYEAKTNLPKLLERASRGERFVITRHGVPVAELVPVARKGGRKVKDTIDEIQRFRKGHKLNF
ncbi:MAG: type II toxin-antitoxin system prevent-host-death family antitoxin [Pseudomonadota bacterium]